MTFEDAMFAMANANFYADLEDAYAKASASVGTQKERTYAISVRVLRTEAIRTANSNHSLAVAGDEDAIRRAIAAKMLLPTGRP